jgi:hypothetical protein
VPENLNDETTMYYDAFCKTLAGLPLAQLDYVIEAFERGILDPKYGPERLFDKTWSSGQYTYKIVSALSLINRTAPYEINEEQCRLR